jgi:hypothetical protein
MHWSSQATGIHLLTSRLTGFDTVLAALAEQRTCCAK